MSTENAAIPPVEYRQLGKSGLRVSVPIFGGMSFGSSKWMNWILDEEEGVEILKAAWDRGINTIDTANAYSNGFSEVIIGKFIEKYSIPRERIIIATKCYRLVGHSPEVRPRLAAYLKDTRDYVNHSGLSRAAIFNAVEASLARLRTTYIDLLQIHRFDPETPVEETMKALHDLIEQGKVRYIGACSMRTWQFAMMNAVAEKNGWTKFISMQSEYSLLYREEEREMYAYCAFNGIGIIPWAPLSGGTLARPLNAPETQRALEIKGTMFERPTTTVDAAIINRVQEIAEKRKKTMAQVAVAWVTGKVTSPIVGVSSIQRLDESVEAARLLLTEDETKYLEEPYQPVPVRGHP